MNSALKLVTIALILLMRGCDASDVISIKLITDTNGAAATGGTVTLTLWYDDMVYKCSVNPNSINTEYSCSDSSLTVVGEQCNCLHGDCLDGEVLIDNHQSADGVVISSISFTTNEGTTFGADGFCINDDEVRAKEWMNNNVKTTEDVCGPGATHYRADCVDNEASGGSACGPGKQIVFLDTSQQDVLITNAKWMDGTYITVDLSPCILYSDPCLAVSCEDDKVCVEGKCERDCELLDIDGFLTDCSDEFKGNEADILAIQDRLNDYMVVVQSNHEDTTAIKDRLTTIEANINDGDITTIQCQLTANEADIVPNDVDIKAIQDRLTTNEANIASNDGDIKAIQGHLLHLVAAHLGGSPAHRGRENSISAGIEASTGSDSLLGFDKDNLIILLLVLNILMIIGGIIGYVVCVKNKYQKVSVYSSADDENQHL